MFSFVAKIVAHANPILTVAVFATTLILVVRKPFGLNMGLAAGIGALLSLLVGTVSTTDVVASLGIIWDAALAFLGIVTLSLVLDEAGLFEWDALKVAWMARGNGRALFLYVFLLSAANSVILANDSTVLILTPIVVEITKHLRLDLKGVTAYAFGAGLVADTGDMPLITSNPVNIVNADYFGISFLQHFTWRALVTVVAVLVNLGVVWLFFRKDVPLRYDAGALAPARGAVRDPFVFRCSVVTLVGVGIGYVIGSFYRWPVSLVVCTGSLFLLTVFTVRGGSAGKVVRTVNWDIFLFMIGIFLVITGLRNVGLVEYV